MNPGFNLDWRALAVADVTPVLSSHRAEQLARALDQADARVPAPTFASAAFSLAVLASALAFLFFALALDLAPALLAALALLPAFFLALLHAPAFLARRRGQRLERDLAFSLPLLAAELEAGAPFETALAESAAGEWNGVVQHALREQRAGLPLSTALANAARRADSPLAQRALAQTAFCYETGADAAGLLALADELASLHRQRTHAFAARLAFFGLVFTALAALVPALFAAYTLVGTAFLESALAPRDVWLAYGLVFPLANLALLAVVHATAPALPTE